MGRKAFYLPVRGDSLFAWYRESPEGVDHRHGILICPPTGYKQVHAHRSLRVLAERLAAEHFPVLSIDLHGTGDSPGSIQDPDRIETWLRNIEDSITWLKEKAGCRRVTVIGLRFGATLAAMVAERQPIDDLILWAPISSGRQYARELRVLSSTTLGRDKPTAKEGDDIEPAGFVVTADTLSQISKLDLLTKSIRADSALILARDDFPDGGRLLNHLRTCCPNVEQIEISDFADMVALPHYCKVPYVAIDRILKRMIEVRGKEPVADSRMLAVEFIEQLKLQTESHAEFVERPMHLSEQPDLFGILAEPVIRPANERPVVLFLNGGASYRVGPNRLYVQTSRALAAVGFQCVRFDLCGLGDSLTPDPADENNSYPETFLRDVDITIQHLQKSLGIRKVVLLGLCAGAYHSYRAAARLTNPALVESIVINPLTFHWKKGMPYEAPVLEELKDLQYYLQMAFRPSKWLRLFSGKTDIGLRGAFNMLMSHRRALKKAEQPKSGDSPVTTAVGQVALSDLAPDADENIPAELAKIAKANRKISFFFSRSDQGRHILLYAAKKSVDKLKRSGTLELSIIENADHTFSAHAARVDLISQVSSHLLNRYGR